MDSTVTREGQRIEFLGKSENLRKPLYLVRFWHKQPLRLGRISEGHREEKVPGVQPSLFSFKKHNKSLTRFQSRPQGAPQIPQMTIPDRSLFPFGAPLGFFGILGGPGLPK